MSGELGTGSRRRATIQAGYRWHQRSAIIAAMLP